jgi:predicted house-cleaning noncanonical NTP pyrophosphatase (MazG superfamily)
LADILEIIYAICDFKKISKKELEKLRKKKIKERGSFKKRIILEKVKYG